MGCSPCTSFDDPKQYLDFVYKLPPLLEQEITVMRPKRKSIWTSMVQRGTLPTQVGTNYQKIQVHTPRFRAFTNAEIYHSRSDTSHGPTAAGPANAMCTIPFRHKLNGLGYERVGLIHRRAFFETCDFCIESLWRENVAPEEFFSEYMTGVRTQLDDIMERTHRNEFESRAQKVWAIYTPEGRLLQHRGNPFEWATLDPTNVVSLPSIEMLYHFADSVLSSYQDYYSIGEVDGEPVYPLIMSSRTKHNLVFKNPKLMEIVRFSSMADNLIEMWQGPLSKIGPFVIFVDNDLTRLKRNLTTGEVLEIPHWIPQPAPDGGEMWVEHPEWTARGPEYYDTIMIPRKDSWKKFIRTIPNSIGGVNFGEQFSPELGLKYVNILDKDCNPFGWIGNFIASHEYYAMPGENMALAPGYVIGVFAGYPGTGNEMIYDEAEVCPPTQTPCNRAESDALPCNQVVCVTPIPTAPTDAFFTFSNVIAPTPVAGATFTLLTKTGGTTTITWDTPLELSADGKTARAVVDITNGPINPDDYVGAACQVVTFCEAEVLGLDDCRSEVTNAARIRLSRALRCNAPGDLITLRWNGGYSADFTVVTADTGSGWVTVRYAAGFGPTDDPTGAVAASTTWDICCDRGKPASACCVPTVGNECTGCSTTFEDLEGNEYTAEGAFPADGCGCTEPLEFTPVEEE